MAEEGNVGECDALACARSRSLACGSCSEHQVLSYGWSLKEPVPAGSASAGGKATINTHEKELRSSMFKIRIGSSFSPFHRNKAPASTFIRCVERASNSRMSGLGENRKTQPVVGRRQIRQQRNEWSSGRDVGRGPRCDGVRSTAPLWFTTLTPRSTLWRCILFCLAGS